ncbi:glycosyltransferase family 2 protein [Tropicimonas sp. IMCC34011]|uniref:glycosyltransferase family 2 protein n=1 Tax=Tropicimonas sp. IMCC34011 TaxID=2248759 RepID=UPI001E589DF6|nr:glycosyltransferase family 2 protein [Tropicimonas sp. IMCC34011]
MTKTRPPETPGAAPDRARYTILSMMKDEGHSVIEWLAYHRELGFDNICVYTNNCNDGTDAMLMRLEALGYCRHFRNDVPEGKKPQPNALSLAEKNPAVMNSDWILTMDADEFLAVKTGDGRIGDLVAALPGGTDAIAITWRFFGSSGLTDWNPGLVTESYTRAAPDQFKKGWGVKTLFRPFENMKLGIHRPHMRKAKQIPERAQAMLKQSWVNGSGQPMPEEFALSGWRSTKPTLGYDLAEMNHYAVKSMEAYLLRRMRGNVNNKADKYNGAYFSIFDRNEIEARTAIRHSAAVKRIMGEMLADPELARLHEAALAYHEARVLQLRQTGEYDVWLAELTQASEVSIDKLDEVLFTQHLPKVWQQKVEEMRASGVSDKAIALMIASSQTARKKETREAMRAAAEGRPAPEGQTSADAAEEATAQQAERMANAAIAETERRAALLASDVPDPAPAPRPDETPPDAPTETPPAPGPDAPDPARPPEPDETPPDAPTELPPGGPGEDVPGGPAEVPPGGPSESPPSAPPEMPPQMSGGPRPARLRLVPAGPLSGAMEAPGKPRAPKMFGAAQG